LLQKYYNHCLKNRRGGEGKEEEKRGEAYDMGQRYSTAQDGARADCTQSNAQACAAHFVKKEEEKSTRRVREQKEKVMREAKRGGVGGGRIPVFEGVTIAFKATL
jgi:hypothetical protein